MTLEENVVMKSFQLIAATLIVGAAALAPAQAQDNTQGGTGTGTGTNQMGRTMMMMNDMNDMDRYRMQWVFRNLDSREVKRHKAAGFDEETIRGAANIAMRTGLPLDYLLRRIQISGFSLTQLSSMYGVPTNVPDDPIPGMGMDTISLEPMGGTGGTGGMRMERTNTTTTTETTIPTTPTTPTNP